MSSIISPEPWGTASTAIVLPEEVRCASRLKAAVTSSIHSSFSEP
jgi:hypothetical protein